QRTKIEHKFPPTCGDARKVKRKYHFQSESPVTMNQPSASNDFAKEPCASLQPSGGTIHYYPFSGENWETDSRNDIEHVVKESGYVAERVLGIHRVREVAPMRWQVAVDLEVARGQ